MSLKRSTVWTAIVAVLFMSPVMAGELSTANNCCETAQCCTAAEDCNLQNCCKTSTIEIGGWLSSGIYANQYGAKDNGPLYMRSYGDGYTVDQMWVYAEKKADNGGCGLAFGGRVDFMWGADGPDTQCFGDGGFDGNWLTSDDENYGSAMPQIYAEMAYNDLRVKVGHFYTIMGYEVVPAPENFFYSHSYAMMYEPLTHTGVLGEYQLNHRVKLQAGLTNGWDNGWLNPSDAATFLGGVTLDLRKNMTLTFTTSFGDLYNADYGEGFICGYADTSLLNPGVFPLISHDVTGYMQSLVFDWQVTSRLNYVLQSNFRTIKGYNTNTSLASLAAKQYGVDQYLIYSINDCWAAGARFEWLRSELSPSGAGDVTSNVTEVTLGLNYKPNDHIVIRPEIRWDFGEASPRVFSYAFDNTTRSSQFSGGFDCIIKY